MASINDLDNPLLVLILNRLCIQKLFTAGHVCVRWNAMRDMSLSERKELLLLIGENAQHAIDESALQIPERRLLVGENGEPLFPDNDQSDVQLQIYSFPLDFSQLLLTHFTNLTTLTISSRVFQKEIESIIHLLEQFNRPDGTLRTLKLFLNLDQIDHDTHRAMIQIRNIRTNLRLLSAVNSIGSLRKLVFDVMSLFVKNSNHPRIDMPILAQLEEFEFHSEDDFVCLHDSITRYAVNNQGLRRIGINNGFDHFTWLLAQSTELLSRFTHLQFYISMQPINRDRFEEVCRQFSHLTSLYFAIDYKFYAIVRQFRSLTHLTNLISLFVTINCDDMTPLSHARREMMNFELPSVKVFTIDILGFSRSHNFFHHCNLNRLFPNVQVVRVIRAHAFCRNCNDKFKESKRKIRIALEEHCARQMFRHFTHCQHLRMVCSKVEDDGGMIIGPRYRKWVWDEMKPFEEEDDDDVEEVEDQDTGDEAEDDEIGDEAEDDEIEDEAEDDEIGDEAEDDEIEDEED